MRKAAKTVFAAGDLFVGRMPGPRILIYHQITSEPTRQMDLAPETFARQLRWLLDHGSIRGLEDALAEPERDGAERDFVLTFDDGYRGLYDHAFPLMRERQIPFALYITSDYVDRSDSVAGDKLTWAQVNEMLETGLMTVGAHTHTHPDLRDLPRSEIAREIEVCNETIERRTGVRPAHFAYPKGYWATEAEDVIRDVYRTAVLGAGEPITHSTNPHRICRVPVQRADGYWFFTRKMQTGLQMEESLRRRVKGYSNPPSVLSSGAGHGS